MKNLGRVGLANGIIGCLTFHFIFLDTDTEAPEMNTDQQLDVFEAIAADSGNNTNKCQLSAASESEIKRNQHLKKSRETLVQFGEHKPISEESGD